MRLIAHKFSLLPRILCPRQDQGQGHKIILRPTSRTSRNPHCDYWQNSRTKQQILKITELSAVMLHINNCVLYLFSLCSSFCSISSFLLLQSLWIKTFYIHQQGSLALCIVLISLLHSILVEYHLFCSGLFSSINSWHWLRSKAKAKIFSSRSRPSILQNNKTAWIIHWYVFPYMQYIQQSNISAHSFQNPWCLMINSLLISLISSVRNE